MNEGREKKSSLRGGVASLKGCVWIPLILMLSLNMPRALAWGNGGYSEDPSNLDYGTHDWIAEHALDWLPGHEKEYIEENLAVYLYATELPDNNQAADGIGDTRNHHVYFYSNGDLQDDVAAVRAQEEYELALGFLMDRDYVNAAKHAGIMVHYIADMAVFGHVMGSDTDWGSEEHHSSYEGYVGRRTESYDDDWSDYLVYDEALELMDAYEACIGLATDTTFDLVGELDCAWMDLNYDWSDPEFKERSVESINLAVNYVADVIHTLYMNSGVTVQVYIIKISVEQEDGDIVEGAMVTSTSQPPGQPPLDGTTGPGGLVTFYDVVEGGYVFRINKSGYAEEVAPATVTTGYVAEITITLQEETTPGGIPGFPVQSVLLGLMIAAFLLRMIKLRKDPRN
ncbi:MAG: hypothetical protein JSV18_06565 [Candidatus Bathyarchaeota archaeon]|nr:MAG: hypothetical protein JSV18_06565 [Candidatus Bathyarchaeota archaeon]